MPELVQGQLGNWSHEAARRKALEQAAQRSGQMQGYLGQQVEVRPEFDYSQQARDAQVEAATINQQSSSNAANNSIVSGINSAVAQQQASAQAALDAQALALTPPVPTGTEGPRKSAYMRALRKTVKSTPQDVDLPNKSQPNSLLGRYGLSEENLQNKQGGDKGGWDRQALGRDVSAEELLKSKKLQNQIARFKFGKLLDRQGETGALTTWHEKTNNPLDLETFLSQILSQLRE